MNAISFPTTPSLFGLPGDIGHERVLLGTDPQTGLKAIIAIHSTARGPSFGGCRYWTYASEAMAVDDALRLSRGMSYKNALADLPYGGGKSVILAQPGTVERAPLFEAFARMVESLRGAYIAAEDVGTTTDDMRVMQTFTPYASGVPRGDGFGGNPSPKTAYGVFVAIEAGVQRVLGRKGLDGVTVAVQGLGSVGWDLCVRLAAAGAKLIVADINPAKTSQACDTFGAMRVTPENILACEADVLAPCALGRALDARSVGNVRARLVAGAANNQLGTLEDGDRLHARGVFYLPDYLVNAGGIVSCVREYEGTGTEAGVMEEVGRIGDRTNELIDRVLVTGEAPARVADAWAHEKLTKRTWGGMSGR
ncbi:MAG: amino acid dehydrogenase [Rhizobacter sp.]|nr:amino acid dehydrogenase [Rhizobacter sp.]